jgi:putative addiction module component (TIGR02574 family)
VTESAQKILQEALALSPAERVVLIDELVSSLDQADPSVDELWAKEAEDRLKAYKAGELEATPAEEVFDEFKDL